MKEIKLKIEDDHYKVIEKVASVQEETIEELTLRALQTCIKGDLCEPLGEALGLGVPPEYDVFSKR